MSNELRAAPEPSRDIFVSRLLKDTETAHLTEHLQKNGVMPRAVVKKSHDEAQFNSFRIELKLSDLSKVLQDTFWPNGVHVRRFYQKQQQHLQDPPPVNPPVGSGMTTHEDQMDHASSQSSDDEQTRLKEVNNSHDG